MVNDVRFLAGPNGATLYLRHGDCMAAKAACPAGIRHDALAVAMHGFAAHPLGYAKGGNF